MCLRGKINIKPQRHKEHEESPIRKINTSIMSPEIEAAIAAIEKLSPQERQQILQMLLESQQPNLEKLSDRFWQGVALHELIESQKPITVNQPQELRAYFWPEEESIDDFLTFMREQRQGTLSSDLS